MLKFAFNQEKAVEALAFIADKWPGITPFYVSKVLFFAEKEHLNAYGRPIIGDTYIAMQQGPVPSGIRDFINSNFANWCEPENYQAAIRIDRSGKHPSVYRRQEYSALDMLSESDMECLAESINFCRRKSMQELSHITHLDKAWANAPEDRPMTYEDFFEEGSPLIEEAKEFSRYGVL